MIESFKKINSILTGHERKIVIILIIASIFTSFTQVVGIGSITPFLAIIANPESIYKNEYLFWAYTTFGFTSENGFLIFLGFFALGAITFSSIVQTGLSWSMTKFINMRKHTISLRLVESYLEKPFIYFLNQNTSNLGKNILSESKHIVSGLISPAMNIVSKGMIAFFILLLLFVINPVLAFTIFIFIGGAYFLVYTFVKNRLSQYGEKRKLMNKLRYKAVSEAFGAIKDIKLLGYQRNFLRLYEESSLEYEQTITKTSIIGMVPGRVIEILVFTSILMIVLYLLIMGEGITNTLPLVGLYSYSILRLKPAIQDIFASLSNFRFYKSSLDELYEDLIVHSARYTIQVNGHKNIEPLLCRDSIQVKKVTFKYPGADEPLFKDLSFSIQANTSIAFVGKTGAGKTTLVDILLGLLQPQSGELLLDGMVINDSNIRSWQKSLGYVPQHIFLSDDSIAKNIAFGIPESEMDFGLVERVAQMASLNDLIMNELPHKYNTIIGERGIRLSGGERQRVGIARALYRNSDVLVLDEATSALDGITEDTIFSAIKTITKTKTVIMIAHRLSTIWECDKVIFLDKGKIVAEGSYDYLIQNNEKFREFAKLKRTVREQAGVNI